MRSRGDRALTTKPAACDQAASEPAALSFDDLYAHDYQPLVRLAFVLLGGHGPAEEIVQDSFAKVYERWDALESPGGYLRTCVVNGCRQALRQRRLVGRRLRAGSAAVAELEADHLIGALACLSPQRRAAVVLRYYLDLSEAEIATTLGVAPGTVKSMLHRSLTQLRGVVER